MHKCGPLIFTVSILSKGGNAPCHIGWTTGAGIPARTLGQIMSVRLDLSGNTRENFQRIDIEKPLSIQLHSRQHRIIKGSFHHICVFGIYFRLQHFRSKEHQTDGCTGFRISRIVGKIIIHRKGFPLNGRTDSSCHIHPPVRNTFKKLPTGIQKLLILRPGRQICHPCIKVNRTDTVTCSITLLSNRLSRLLVIVIRRVIPPDAPISSCNLILIKTVVYATHIDEVLGKYKAFLISCSMVKPEQRQFDLRMSRIAFMTFCHKVLINMCRILLHHTKKLILTGGFVVGNCGLHHMSGAVQFMSLQQIGPSLILILDGIVGIQVSVRILCRFNLIDQAVSLCFQISIRKIDKTVSHSLKPFGGITVLKYHSIKAVPNILPAHSLCCILEICHNMTLFNTLHLIMKDCILVRNNDFLYELLITVNKPLCAFKMFHIYLSLLFHAAPLSFFLYMHYNPYITYIK